MLLLTIGKASTQPYSPSRQYLSKLSKHENKPDYFILDNDKYKINVQHPEWLTMIKKRADDNPEMLLNKNIPKSIQHPGTTTQTTLPENPKSKAEAEKHIQDLIEQSQIANLEEQILKNKKISYVIEQEKIKLKKQSGGIAEIPFIEFIYFGYMEKINIELLALNKKIRPIIENLVKEKDFDGVFKRYQREFESLLRQIKSSQKADLEKWESEK